MTQHVAPCYSTTWHEDAACGTTLRHDTRAMQHRATCNGDTTHRSTMHDGDAAWCTPPQHNTQRRSTVHPRHAAPRWVAAHHTPHHAAACHATPRHTPCAPCHPPPCIAPRCRTPRHTPRHNATRHVERLKTTRCPTPRHPTLGGRT